MWTIIEFFAYTMVSSWLAYGKLVYLYCLDNNKAFTLINRGKYFFIIVTGGSFQVIIDLKTT